MKKNFKKKTMTYEHKGYALYDSDLSPKYFTESLNEVIGLHDVFKHVFKKNTIEMMDVDYTFEEIHSLDQISLTSKLDSLKEKPLKQAAEFKLIYFNNNLRGFYYRFNGFMFDERSVKKVLQAIEKQYFKGKYRQTSTSYSKWLNENYHSFKPAFITGQFKSYVKKLTLDEALTKRVRTYLKENDLTMIQFLTGVIGIYYKVAKRKDLAFTTNYFNEEQSVIGSTKGKKSYRLKKNPKVSTKAFICNNWIEKDEYSHVVIQLKESFKELKGQVTSLVPVDVPYEIGFFINEKDWEVEIDIICQKYKFKNDDLFLMLTKLRMIIFNILEADDTIEAIDLLTKNELVNAFSGTEIKSAKHQSLYNWFKMVAKEHQPRVAFSGSKTLTFEKLERLVDKFYKQLGTMKSIGKDDRESYQINLNDLKDYEQVAALIALESVRGVYVKEGGYGLKKGLLGMKIAGQAVQGQGMYEMDSLAISREGYLQYCYEMKQHLKFHEDDVASMNDLLMFGLPVLLSGGRISTTEQSIAYVKKDDLKEDLPYTKVVTNASFIKDQYSYDVYYGLQSDQTVPFAFLGRLGKGKVEKLHSVSGMGFVILNKQKKLTQAFEKGKIYAFGPAVNMNIEMKNVELRDETFDSLTGTGITGFRTYDGHLKVN